MRSTKNNTYSPSDPAEIGDIRLMECQTAIYRSGRPTRFRLTHVVVEKFIERGATPIKSKPGVSVPFERWQPVALIPVRRGMRRSRAIGIGWRIAKHPETAGEFAVTAV